MAARNSFKSDSSFFRMLAAGAVGAEAVQQHLNALGHNIVELERGSLATRIWRDVKRKRVRIPDLACTNCGTRIESRAKTRADLAMSHSPHDAERAWSYGMLDSDWIAFPILTADEGSWGAGSLDDFRSLWRERALTTWILQGRINLFTVGSFRSAPHLSVKPKGVSEGSEVQVKWKARFAPGAGSVIAVSNRRLDYLLDTAPDRPRYFRLGAGEHVFVEAGQRFECNQIIAGPLAPLTPSAASCTGGCDSAKLKQMIASRERTVRFTGCKLARFAKDIEVAEQIREVALDVEEDAYVRMEARSYLCEVAGASADEQFRATLLFDMDEQMRLEAAVALAETRTQGSFKLLQEVLEDPTQPLFLRTACAWGIGCHGTEEAAQVLVKAFADATEEIRQEAVMALHDLGSIGFGPLIVAMEDGSTDVAAGAAEALRRIKGTPAKDIAAAAERATSTWPTWTLAHLPKNETAPHLEALKARQPEAYYAVSVIWTFLESWIAKDWTPRSTP